MNIKFLVFLFSIGVLWKTSHGFGQHYGYDHGGSNVYVHSNDTMALELDENTDLKVEARSTHSLEFRFTNRGSPGHFTFRLVVLI